MNELALFAGAGGGILGGHLLGWRCVCAVEWDAYSASVLVASQNDGCLQPFPIWDDVQTFDGRPWRGRVDVVSGGFPCQDISAAGRGAGITGERSGMWKHMGRIIGEILPRFVLVENSPMLVGRGLTVVLADLTALGYDARWGIVGAHHAGAPHKRDRIWIVGYSNATSDQSPEKQSRQLRQSGRAGEVVAHSEVIYSGRLPERANEEHYGHCVTGEDLADTTSERQSRSWQPWYACDPAEKREGETDWAWAERVGCVWGIESNLGRVANGVANRMDRLKAIGNGQVPSVVKLAWETLSQ